MPYYYLGAMPKGPLPIGDPMGGGLTTPRTVAIVTNPAYKTADGPGGGTGVIHAFDPMAPDPNIPVYGPPAPVNPGVDLVRTSSVIPPLGLPVGLLSSPLVLFGLVYWLLSSRKRRAYAR